MAASHAHEVDMLGLALLYMTGIRQKLLHGEVDEVTEVLFARCMLHTYYSLLLRDGTEGMSIVRFPRGTFDETEAVATLVCVFREKYPDRDVTCFSKNNEAVQNLRLAVEDGCTTSRTLPSVKCLPARHETMRGTEHVDPIFLEEAAFIRPSERLLIEHIWLPLYG